MKNITDETLEVSRVTANVALWHYLTYILPFTVPLNWRPWSKQSIKLLAELRDHRDDGIRCQVEDETTSSLYARVCLTVGELSPASQSLLKTIMCTLAQNTQWVGDPAPNPGANIDGKDDLGDLVVCPTNCGCGGVAHMAYWGNKRILDNRYFSSETDVPYLNVRLEVDAPKELAELSKLGIHPYFSYPEKTLWVDVTMFLEGFYACRRGFGDPGRPSLVKSYW